MCVTMVFESVIDGMCSVCVCVCVCVIVSQLGVDGQ